MRSDSSQHVVLPTQLRPPDGGRRRHRDRSGVLRTFDRSATTRQSSVTNCRKQGPQASAGLAANFAAKRAGTGWDGRYSLDCRTRSEQVRRDTTTLAGTTLGRLLIRRFRVRVPGGARSRRPSAADTLPPGVVARPEPADSSAHVLGATDRRPPAPVSPHRRPEHDAADPGRHRPSTTSTGEPSLAPRTFRRAAVVSPLWRRGGRRGSRRSCPDRWCHRHRRTRHR